MRKTVFFLIVIAILLMSCGHKLIVNGVDGWQIVLPTRADTVEEYAARQLQYYLFEMSKSRLPIVDESNYNGDNAITLGALIMQKP